MSAASSVGVLDLVQDLLQEWDLLVADNVGDDGVEAGLKLSFATGQSVSAGAKSVKRVSPARRNRRRPERERDEHRPDCVIVEEALGIEGMHEAQREFDEL